MAERTSGRLVVAVVAAIVGFLLVGQFRGNERFTERLEAESEGDLARILASLDTESQALRDEIDSLRVQLLTLEGTGARDEAARDATRAQLDALAVLAGTAPVHGPGVVIEIADPRGVLSYDAFVDLVQELRDAGAEAIAVDGRRIGATTAFGGRAGHVTVDGTEVGAPYRVVAIGRPETVEAGLGIPGGAVDTLEAAPGVSVRVSTAADERVPALARPPAFRVGRPVESP